MRALAERESSAPGIGELVGVAVNASKLVLVANQVGALDVIAALGYASLAMLQRATDVQQRLGAVLAPQLMRAKYGHDQWATVHCVLLFERRLLCRPYLEEIDRTEPGLVRRFSAQTMHEWLSDSCPICGGSGWLEAGRHGTLRRPTSHFRNIKLQSCGGCAGGGRRRPNEQERRRALAAGGHRSVHRLEYSDFWRRQFTLALQDLRDLVRSPRDHLQGALSRGRVRA